MKITRKIYLYLAFFPFALTVQADEIPNNCQFFPQGIYWTFNTEQNQNNNSELLKEISDIIKGLLKFEESRRELLKVIFDEELMNSSVNYKDDEPELIIGLKFLESLQHTFNNKWLKFFIIAHLIKHHYVGHTYNQTKYKSIESQVDYKVGSVIAQYGGELEDALKIFEVAPIGAFPNKKERVQAVTDGWKRAHRNINIHLIDSKSLNSEILNEIGLDYKYGENGINDNDINALEFFTKAANSGNTDAMVNVANMYFDHNNINVNLEITMSWYLKAAQLGNGRAMYFIGHSYEKGALTEFYNLAEDEQYEKALYWYTGAVEAGESESMNRIGNMYSNGLGVEKNKPEAEKWFNKYKEAQSLE